MLNALRFVGGSTLNLLADAGAIWRLAVTAAVRSVWGPFRGERFRFRATVVQIVRVMQVTSKSSPNRPDRVAQILVCGIKPNGDRQPVNIIGIIELKEYPTVHRDGSVINIRAIHHRFIRSRCCNIFNRRFGS